MTAKITITINGTEYPCYFTLGAGLAFEQLTGHDVSEMNEKSLVEIGTLLFCQCKSACRREGIEFPYDYESFMDQVTDEDLMSVARKQPEASKKK